MKTYCPTYSSGFSCLAAACPDSCCCGWEIVIDDETVASYRAESGAIGEKLRSVMARDADGDTVFCLDGGRCPFLAVNGLCEIYSRRSSVCREHPWFTEEYEGFTEKSLSLSCPAACSLILGSPLDGAYNEISESCGDEVLNVLVRARNELLISLDEKNSFDENRKILFELSRRAQGEINRVEPNLAVEINSDKTADINDIIMFLIDNCEILTEEWRQLLKRFSESSLSGAFEKHCAQNSVTLNRALGYYVYRYFLKAVNDLDCMAGARFITASVLVPAALAFASGTELSNALRLYSKEVEHDTENPQRIREYLSGMDNLKCKAD